MSKSVEETRRELFEAWYTDNGTIGRIFSTDSGNYISELAQNSWEAFNAALDAVEIELPKSPNPRCFDGFDWGVTKTVEQCQINIDSLNLGIKVK